MSAIFSEDRSRRLLLSRGAESQPYVLFIGLNPSTAAEVVEDATSRRWWGFTESWGFSHYKAVNLSAVISTDPKQLRDVEFTGEEDDYLINAMCSADKIVVCYGAGVKYLGKQQSVLRPKWLTEQILRRGLEAWCWGRTKEGHPKHPLYLPDGAPLEVFL